MASTGTEELASPPATAAQAPEGWDCHVHVFDEHAPVLAGHYRPPTRSLAAIEARAHAAGVGHLVLVQPSVYGTDNSLMLQALQASAGRHRGVAVVDADIRDVELDRLHAAGVRGIRINRVSPVGTPGDPSALLQRLGPRLRERGWHVQWYLRREQLPELPAWQLQSQLVFVLDHLAGMNVGSKNDTAAWSALAALADAGAWVKLSGWYRLDASPPYDTLHPVLARVAATVGERLVWGSDWPHTSLDQSRDWPYDFTWAPVRDTLPPARAQAIRQTLPWQLYR